VAVRAKLEIARKPIDSKVSFFLFRPVATDAMFLKERFEGFLGANGAGDGEEGQAKT
jgi:hypothetical protein